jgi:hypothetical protein
MAMRAITSLYDTYDDAVRTVEDLEAAGIPANDISIVANRGTSPAVATVEEPRHAASGAATGATVGAAVGAGAALLAGLGWPFPASDPSSQLAGSLPLWPAPVPVPPRGGCWER